MDLITLNIGETFENSNVRIHRYRDMIYITDIENAGKKGKECRHVTIENYLCDEKTNDDLTHFTNNLNKVCTYAVVECCAMLLEAENNKIKLHYRSEKSIDVIPFNHRPIEFTNDRVRFCIKYDGFSIRELHDVNEPTIIDYHKTKKLSVKKLYKYVRENKAEVEKLSFYEARQLLIKLDVNYHSYCALD